MEKASRHLLRIRSGGGREAHAAAQLPRLRGLLSFLSDLSPKSHGRAPIWSGRSSTGRAITSRPSKTAARVDEPSVALATGRIWAMSGSVADEIVRLLEEAFDRRRSPSSSRSRSSYRAYEGGSRRSEAFPPTSTGSRLLRLPRSHGRPGAGALPRGARFQASSRRARAFSIRRRLRFRPNADVRGFQKAERGVRARALASLGSGGRRSAPLGQGSRGGRAGGWSHSPVPPLRIASPRSSPRANRSETTTRAGSWASGGRENRKR
jgi:hypothetical protein